MQAFTKKVNDIAVELIPSLLQLLEKEVEAGNKLLAALALGLNS